MTGILISQFKGTPLFALANNANVYGGETLDDIEFSIMKRQMKNLGMTFDEFQLDVQGSDLAGKTAKETRKNIEEVGTALQKAYKKQFDSKEGVQTAQNAEVRADSIIKTALDFFYVEHSGINFVPKELGARPQFTSPEYKDNAGLYAVDVVSWANRVANEYKFASSLTIEELTAMIMDNDDRNTAFLSAENIALATQILTEVRNGNAVLLSEVKSAKGEIIKTIRNTAGQIIQVVQDSAGKIIQVAEDQGRRTRNTVIGVGAQIINDNRFQHAATKSTVLKEGASIRNTVRDEATATRNKDTQNAREVKEIDTMNAAITNIVTSSQMLNGDLGYRVGQMQTQIVQSTVSHSLQKQLLQAILNQLKEVTTTDSELDRLQDLIDRNINNPENQVPQREGLPPLELPDYPPPPEPVKPIYEEQIETPPVPKKEVKNGIDKK